MTLLEGKVAAVTGAGGGLGAAIARGFASEGATVILVDLDIDAAQQVAQDIAESGGRAQAVRVDILDRVAVSTLAERLTAEYGAVHILVNNAGISPKISIEDADAPERWSEVVALNLTAQFTITHALLPALKREGGSIIYLASIAAFSAPRSSAAYGASKAGLVSLTKTLARDLAPFGVRVNALAPGIMATNLTAISRQGDTSSKYLQRVPMARFGEPSEIAGPAIFLASDLASYVTGVTLPVDGGVLAV